MAEQKTIVLNKGIRRTPTGSDVGELTECVNLIAKNGELVNAPTMTQVPGVTIPDGYTLVYIHKTSEGDNYILAKDGKLCYMRAGGNGVVLGDVPQSVKNELYIQYVDQAAVRVKQTKEQLFAVNNQLASINTEYAGQANTKLAEFAHDVDNIFLQYLQMYDDDNQTTEKTSWQNLTPSQKFSKLYLEDYEDFIYRGIETGTVPEKRVYSGGVDFSSWLEIPTANGKYLMTCPAKNAMQGDSTYRRYQQGDKAFLYVEHKTETLPNGDNGTYTNTYIEVLEGAYDVDGEDLFTWDERNTQNNYPKDIATILSDNNDSIANDAEYSSAVSTTVYFGSKDAYTNMRNAFLAISRLVDDYYKYWYAEDNATNKSALEARKAELEAALLAYNDALAQAQSDYNSALITAAQGQAEELAEGTYKNITSVGNTLCIGTESNLVNCIYHNGKYVKLDFPTLDLQFRLRSEFATAVSDSNISIETNANTQDYVRTDSSIFLAEAKNDDDPVFGSYIGEGLFGADRHSYAHDYVLPPQKPLEANKWFKIVLTTGNKKATDKWHFYLYDGDTEVLGQTDISRSDNKWVLERILDKQVTKIRIVYGDRYSGHVSQPTTKGITLNCDIYTSENTSRYGIKRTSDNFTAIEGNINRFIKSQSVDKDRFMFPFFVRYAYKTYDGRYIYPSAPILMLPNTGRVPFVVASQINDALSVTPEYTYFDCNAFVASLEYRIMSDENSVRSLLSYKEIIKEIVIAVSAPIYTYDTAAIFDENKPLPFGIEHVEYGMSKDVDYSISAPEGSNYSRKMSIWERTAELTDRNGALHGDYICLKLPSLTKEEIEKNVKNSSNFYVIKSISIDDIVSNYNALTFIPVNIENGTLDGLLGRERITDNSITLHRYIPDTLIAYNSRLLLGGLHEAKYKGYNAGILSSNMYSEAIWTYLNITNPSDRAITTYQDENSNYIMNVHYGTIIEYSADNSTHKQYRPIDLNEVNVGINGIRWFYYPSSQAKKVTIYRYRKGTTINWRNQAEDVHDLARVTLDLKEHPMLDGAYWFDNFNEVLFNEHIDVATDANGNIIDSQSYDSDTRKMLGYEPITDDIVVHSNKIIQTEVINPLTLDINSAEYIGNGKIMAIAPNTTALSQGQFGQHPVMCFTSEGMYALAIDGEGKIANKQPYSRDVIKDNTVPLLTDSSIIFATDSGLKMMSSRGIEDISSQMFGARENFPLGGILAEYSSIIPDDNVSFVSVLDGCKMMYDSVNKLIHVYSSRLSGVHYVMSLVSGEWSQMEGGTPNSVVVGYPYSIMQIAGSLYEYKETDDTTTTRKGLLLTREISFDNPFAMKMLHWIRLIRKSVSNDCKIAVFVSNDRDNWMRLRSLKSHSYKWYRIAVFTQMTDVDAIEGIVCGVEARRVNKIR